MYCVNCATQLQANWKHCPNCGQSNVSSKSQQLVESAGVTNEPPVPYSKAQKELDAASYDALIAAGKPDLVRRNGKIELKNPLTDEGLIEYARSVLSPTSFKIWKAAGYPDINSFIAGIEEQLAEIEVSTKPAYKVRYIGSEDELRKLTSKEVFKVWKKRGKPRVVIIDEKLVMYEVQLNFFEFYGYEMSGDMVDAWYWVGCPDIKVWDVQGTMERYFQNAQQILGIQAQSASTLNAFAIGLAEIGGVLARNTQQSGLDAKGMMQGLPINQCSKCGTPLTGRICRYCQK